jgi:hypothetical protein
VKPIAGGEPVCKRRRLVDNDQTLVSNDQVASIDDNSYDSGGIIAGDLRTTSTASKPAVCEMSKAPPLRAGSQLPRENTHQKYEPHTCNCRRLCSVRHDSLPYLWRFCQNGIWVPFDDSRVIERIFSDPSCQSVTASFQASLKIFRVLTPQLIDILDSTV